MDELNKQTHSWTDEQRAHANVSHPPCRLELLSHVSPNYPDCYLQDTLYSNYHHVVTSQDCAVTSPYSTYGMTSPNCVYDSYYDGPSQDHELDLHRSLGSREFPPVRCDAADEMIGENHVVSCMKIHLPDGASPHCSRYLKAASSNNSLYSSQHVSAELFGSSSLTSQEQYLALLKDGDLDESTLGGIFFEDGVPYQCSPPLSYSDGAASVKSELFSTDYFKGADDDDVIRKRRRREQNRRAARKCREKKKENVDNMLQEYSDTLKENARLRMEMDGLQNLVVKLQTVMRRHQLTCKLL